MPIVIITYIASEISLVLRDLIVLTACGTNAPVVSVAAANPNSSVSMGALSHLVGHSLAADVLTRVRRPGRTRAHRRDADARPSPPGNRRAASCRRAACHG